MSTKEIKTLERYFLEEANKGKAAAMAVMDETCAADLVVHGGAGRDINGLRDFKQYCNRLFSAFPDNHFTLDDVIVEGDKAVIRYTTTGTHKGEFMGIPPTNKRVTFWALELTGGLI